MRRLRPGVWAACLAFVVGCANGAPGTFGATDGGVEGGEDGGNGNTGQPCVKNDDCSRPDLCQGNNGLECKGGFCVETGKPMNCDDGVACTQDVCDATKNRCVHTPNDQACPASSYCDPTLNCVQSLPCMPGDSVCDRLNVDACDGPWTCDAQKKLCVKGPKPCPDRPNAKTTCMGTMCSWTCNTGFFDTNADLNVPPMQMSNGCECNQTSQTDKPDMQFVDADCDGIDGTETKAIFVDVVSGNDGNPGTKAQPKKSIGAGLLAANAANPKKDVYVSKGTYTELVDVPDGVSVYGGYDAAAGWSRALVNVTRISSPTTVGVRVANAAQALEIQLLTIESANASGTAVNGDGLSSYGVLIVGSSGGVTVRGCTISAGSGGPGAAGATGATGAAGQKGGDASGTTPGGPGSSPCGAPGGAGGAGVNGTQSGAAGAPGTQAPGGGAPAAGGAPGSAGECSTTSSAPGGSAPSVQFPGSTGNPGTNGSSGAPLGTFDASGAYLAAAGGPGVSSGFPGGGGGGGGSGGGTAHGHVLFPSFCTDCASHPSGAGGGGGGGGCGGGPGAGGRGGGGSFAIVVVNSTATVESTKMTTAQGGNGGAGGNGGLGGAGGAGGAGAAGVSHNSGCSNISAGNGASGSAGGAGGRGGAGAGGTGGPSVCIVYKGGAPTTSGTQCTNGGGGAGGPGGTNGSQQAPQGTAGVTGDLRAAM
jgi:hypothetical protein